MMNSYVYTLVDPRNNLPFYVGKGVGRRCFFHSWEARNTKNISRKLNKIRQLHKHGVEAVIRKVEENVTDEQAKDLECLLIEEMRDIGIKLTNMTDGGDGTAGYKQSLETIARTRHDWTDEQKQKISESLKGERNPNYGKPCDEARRQAIIKGTTGVKKSTTENMKKPKRKEQCPHCGIMASGGNLARWHMDNCKSKE
jgi:ribosomal protein S27AE